MRHLVAKMLLVSESIDTNFIERYAVMATSIPFFRLSLDK